MTEADTMTQADTDKPFVRPDVQAMLTLLEQMDRPNIEDLPLAEARETMRTMAQLAEADPREMAVIKDLTCPGPAGDIPLRFYDSKPSREPGPCVVFYHGGGFVIGDLEVYHSICTEIAYQLDLPVVSVDYRLAPEHPFPAAPDDCEAATRWVASSPAQLEREITGLVLTGDSAGGNLTIVTSNQLMQDPADVPVLVQAPIYPVASDLTEHESLQAFADGYFLTGPLMAWFSAHYTSDPDDPKDPRHTPMAGDCTMAPATVLCTAGLDPLRDSGRDYAAHLITNGISTHYLEFPGIIHGFITMRKAIPSAQEDTLTLLQAIKGALASHG